MIKKDGFIEVISQIVHIINKAISALESKIILYFILSDPIERGELKEIAKGEGSIDKIRAVPSTDFEYSSSSVPTEISRVMDVTSKKNHKYCYGLRDVKLWGSSDVNHIIIYDKRRPVLETTHNSREMYERYVKNIINEQGIIKSLIFLLEIAPFYHRIYDKDVDSVFNLAHKPHYYSWITLVLPKLEVFEKSKLTGDSEVLVYDELSKFDWAEQSLELLGIESEDQTKWSGKNLLVKELFFSSRTSQSNSETIGFNPDPGDREWVRKQAISNLSQNTSNKYASRVYISRSDADARRVVNEEELLDKLKPLGFEAYSLSKLDFEEQVRLFNQADIILGPHGAGFANMTFSEDATVIELFKSDDVRPCYFVEACELRFDYEYILCEPVNGNMKCSVDKIVEVASGALEIE